jgi:hypothetical protein
MLRDKPVFFDPAVARRIEAVTAGFLHGCRCPRAAIDFF